MPQNAIGLNAVTTTGKLAPLQLDAAGNLITSLAGSGLCMGANPSGVTTSAGLATTYVGLVLSNPAGSGIGLLLRRVAGAFIVAPATVTGFNLIVGYSAAGIVTHTTPLTPISGEIGLGPTPAAKLDSAATLVGTPAYSMVLAETPTATTLLSFSVDLNGTIILPPGAYAAIGTTIAGPASGFQGSFQWQEAPGYVF